MSAPAPAPETRRLLSLTPTGAVHRAGRSPMTCQWRCDNACSHPIPNPTEHQTFAEVVASTASRRTVIKGGSLAAAVVGLTTFAGVGQAVAAPSAATGGAGADLGFTGIAPVTAGTDKLVVPQGFGWAPVISWGDPIVPGAPAFDFDNQSAQAQAGQFGYNNDYTDILPTRRANVGILVCNNEYTNDELMFRGFAGSASLSVEQLRISMAAHGMSVVEVTRASRRAPWRHNRKGAVNRRITASTPMRFDGPAAGHAMLVTGDDPSGRYPLGTLANCSGGTTPWGTVLSGEENFNGYFKAPTTAPADQAAAYARYGITGGGRGWERADPRFDLAVEPHEVNRFGWVVEVDPTDPASTPVKHTGLGRLKHEGATTVIAPDGRVVVYTGDDERFDYLYKFISHERYDRRTTAAARRHNLTLLSSGDLHVAKFTGDGMEDGVNDGSGTWLPLVVNNRSKVPGFTTAEVLIWTRLAADVVGPTKMDRPEDVQTSPVNGRTYVVCTNNTSRVSSQVDEANPRPANKHGHIVEIQPQNGDHAKNRFTWSLVLIAGDPEDPSTYFAGYDKSQVSPISCPDNIAFDADGNLWIATDGNALDACDGMYVMPLAGPDRGHLQQFLSVPAFSECCGPVVLPENHLTVLAAVQHPGETEGASPDAPASLFPYRGNTQPRPAVIQAFPR